MASGLLYFAVWHWPNYASCSAIVLLYPFTSIIIIYVFWYCPAGTVCIHAARMKVVSWGLLTAASKPMHILFDLDGLVFLAHTLCFLFVWFSIISWHGSCFLVSWWACWHSRCSCCCCCCCCCRCCCCCCCCRRRCCCCCCPMLTTCRLLLYRWNSAWFYWAWVVFCGADNQVLLKDNQAIVGVAASRYHTAIITSSKLYVFGTDRGQLGMSLYMQYCSVIEQWWHLAC